MMPLGGSAGVKYYRQELPFRHVAGPLAAEGVVLSLPDPNRTIDFREWDCVHFARGGPAPHFFPLVLDLAARGIKISVDLDDNMFSLPKWNPAYDRSAMEPLTIGQTLAMASGVSVSTHELAAAVAPRAKATVSVCPNLIDPADWPEPSPARADVLLWHGSECHEADLLSIREPLRDICSHAGAPRVVFFGYCPKEIRSDPLIRPTVIERCQNLDQFRRTLSLLGPTVGMAPLSVDPGDVAFNTCKSAIKIYEYAMAGAAAVATDCPPYSTCGLPVALAPRVDFAEAVAEAFASAPALSVACRDAVLERHSWSSPSRAAWTSYFLGLSGS